MFILRIDLNSSTSILKLANIPMTFNFLLLAISIITLFLAFFSEIKETPLYCQMAQNEVVSHRKINAAIVVVWQTHFFSC